MRHVVIALVLLGCGAPQDPKRAGGPNAGSGSSTARVASGSGAGPSAPIVLKDIGCLVPTCAFHAGVAAYFTCQASGSGTCFHFGAACTPERACMYDPVARSYKTCQRPVEGTCQVWGGACAPASRCMFDPSDGLHRECDSVDAGRCKRYGALCAP